MKTKIPNKKFRIRSHSCLCFFMKRANLALEILARFKIRFPHLFKEHVADWEVEELGSYPNKEDIEFLCNTSRFDERNEMCKGIEE